MFTLIFDECRESQIFFFVSYKSLSFLFVWCRNSYGWIYMYIVTRCMGKTVVFLILCLCPPLPYSRGRLWAEPTEPCKHWILRCFGWVEILPLEKSKDTKLFTPSGKQILYRICWEFYWFNNFILCSCKTIFC